MQVIGIILRNTMPKKATRKKTKRKPCDGNEKIYRSILGEQILTHQYINELLCIHLAGFLGLPINQGHIDGERFFEHPRIKPFYDKQWGDISTMIRRYGGRNVAAAVAGNKWICDPKYGNGRPLLMKKIQAIMKEMKVANTMSEPEELPHNHEAPRQKEQRDF